MPGAPNQYAIGSDHWPGVSKLIEEMGELGQVLGKVIALGLDQHVPTLMHWDGTDLRDRLVDEIGDVYAALRFLIERNLRGFEREAVYARQEAKTALFNGWQDPPAPEPVYVLGVAAHSLADAKAHVWRRTITGSAWYPLCGAGGAVGRDPGSPAAHDRCRSIACRNVIERVPDLARFPLPR